MAKRSAARPADVIDIGPVSEDEQLATTDGQAIATWVQSLRQFFTTAMELERSAKGTLDIARTLKLPTNATEDEAIQRFVKATTEARKDVEAHWGVTSVIHRFHRRLTAKRDLASKALEEANGIGNRLHVQYSEAERRRAAEEERRQREQVETVARKAREAELARFEADAVKAEENSPELSEREQLFVERYVIDGNAQYAAKVAGYKDAFKAAARLMSQDKILAALKARQNSAEIRRQAAAKAAAPLAVENVTVTPDITRASGASDRTTWSGEILDEQATILAFREGRSGIPSDLFQINQAKLNEYARSLHERLDLWAGVRAKKVTRVV